MRWTGRPDFGRLSWAKRFLLASLVILLLGMAGIGAWVARQIAEGVVHRTGLTTALYVDSLVAPGLRPLATADTLPPASVDRLDWLLKETPLGQAVTLFRVWDRTGRVVYSTEPVLVGQQFPVEGELADALGGSVAADIGALEGGDEVSSRVPPGDLLEIYSPVRNPDTGEVIAVAEFYYGTEGLRSEIAAAQWRSWLVVAGATAVIYLLLAAFVQRASNTIRRQQSALTGQVARLTELLGQNRELHERVRGAAARTTALNERILRRLSAELHDGPAQDVSLALLQLDHVAARCGNGTSAEDREAMERDLDLVGASLRRALGEIRGTSSGLLLPQLGSLTVEQTVERVARSHQRRTGAPPDLSLRNLPEQAPLVAKIALYRVVQEALSNGWRHAGGVGQRVSVAGEEGRLRAEICDQGPGFDVSTVGASAEHLGLIGMRERVESLGGEFRVRSAPGQGTCVVAALPLAETGGLDG